MSAENASHDGSPGGVGRRSRTGTARKKRRRRKRRLTDKIRAALARAAALGRHDVTEELGSIYQARMEEERNQGQQRRARDSALRPRRPLRGR